MNETLKLLYDRFYTPLPMVGSEQEVETCHRQLIERLDKPEDSDWVVLPVANFDAYFGTTSFGRKYLKQIPETILERSETGFGLCRYRLGGTLVIK